MINEKDQAIYLLNNYAHVLRSEVNYTQQAKQCAVMAVDLLILDYAENDASWTESAKYWIRVKDEILKLSSGYDIDFAEWCSNKQALFIPELGYWEFPNRSKSNVLTTQRTSMQMYEDYVKEKYPKE